MTTKACPFCAEKIEDRATKCPSCGHSQPALNQEHDAARAEKTPALPDAPQTSYDTLLANSPFRRDPEDRSVTEDDPVRLAQKRTDKVTAKDLLIDTAIVAGSAIVFSSVISLLAATAQFKGQGGVMLIFLYALAGMRKQDSYYARRKRLLLASVCVGAISGLINALMTWEVAQADPDSTGIKMSGALIIALSLILISAVLALIGNWLSFKMGKRP